MGEEPVNIRKELEQIGKITGLLTTLSVPPRQSERAMTNIPLVISETLHLFEQSVGIGKNVIITSFCDPHLPKIPIKHDRQRQILCRGAKRPDQDRKPLPSGR